MRTHIRYLSLLLLTLLCSFSFLPGAQVFANTTPVERPAQAPIFALFTFSTDTTIDSGDTTYDGHDILIDGATVTINGLHNFNSVTVQNGGTLTHAAATADTTYALELTIATTLSIDASSSINVSGLGYLAGYTLGNTTTGGATGYAGGSYGGMGGYYGTTPPNLVYGDYQNPNELGSGGGAAAGGGLVRIVANTATIDGAILANGTGAYYGSGSGGGIWLNVNSLNGSGTIAVNGGSSGSNGYASGGGGRIAILYQSINSYFLNTQAAVTAYGEIGGTRGAAGTVYFKPEGAMGTLRIVGHPDGSGSWTPLGLPSDTEVVINDTVVITGTDVVIRPEHQMPVTIHKLDLLGGAKLTTHATTADQEYSLTMVINDALNIDSQSLIDVSGLGYLAGYTFGNTTTGGATGYAGGSYGGMGGYYGTTPPNLVYGDYQNPNELGSGGGAAAGGGLVRIVADTATIDGAILANGTGAYHGSGSGGGIWLNVVNTLNGSGTIAANGGSSGSNGYASGGGGRIALEYQTINDHFLNTPSAVTAYGATGGTRGSPGTIYRWDNNNGSGTLHIVGHPDGSGSWTPLGLPGDAEVFINDTVVITGTGVVIRPEHQMPVSIHKLDLLGGAKLTTHTTNANQEYSLLMSITDTLKVDNLSLIDVSGLGYPLKYTIGLTSTGGATGYAGGSYGGMGGYYGTTPPNLVYGDYQNPNELGSGGGNAAGGGLVRIAAHTINLDGAILVNGIGNYYGSGSGGGIWLNVNTLNGSGAIATNGGSSGSNGYASGGGGRIALYYQAISDHFLNTPSAVTAYGGTGGTRGAPGTIYLKQTGAMGTLHIYGDPIGSGSWTPLGLPGDAEVFINDTVVITGTGVVIRPEHQMPVSIHKLDLLGGAKLTTHTTNANQEYSLLMSITDTLKVDNLSLIDVSGLGYPLKYTIGLTSTGGAKGYAGGSYGGMGGYYGTTPPNLVYGDYQNPNELGSGGGEASGGGLVRIAAHTLTLDGSMLANGTGAYYGSGSGGGIWLNVNTLNGSGAIATNGGSSGSNGYASGGGGRIALYYQAISDHFLNTPSAVTAYGGTGGTKGAPGTIYFEQTGEMGTLHIYGDPIGSGSWTPLGLPGDAEVFINDTVVITGTGVVIRPEHQMPVSIHKLDLLGGAKLTTHTTNANQEYSLLMSITDTLKVDNLSLIDVSGLGYPLKYTIGLTSTGGATGYAGGSYGGMGGYYGTTPPNLVYGDYQNPNELGSGGGAAAGGGLVRIAANTITLDGSILANGTGAYYGSGSGGGIWLNVNTLNGSGAIATNGGSSGSNGYASGGGGRIALYYQSINDHFLNTSSSMTAYGGTGDIRGAPGTIYLEQTGAMGTLHIYGDPIGSGSWTPLGLPGDTEVILNHVVVITGTGLVIRPEHQMPVTVHSLDLLGGAKLTTHTTNANQEYSLLMSITDTLKVDDLSLIDVSGLGYPLNYTIGLTSTGGAKGYAGGSYGGMGGYQGSNSPNLVYGDYQNPNELGSGGGAAAGGGLVRIAAHTINLDGAILVNGIGNYYGSGSGGGIWLNVNTLNGSGAIATNGGSSGSNGYASGSGGRIALYYQAINDHFLNTPSAVTAYGGTGGTKGAPGTIYFEQTGEMGTLHIYGDPIGSGSWTPLGLPGDAAIHIAAPVIVSGTGVLVMPEHEMMVRSHSMSLLNGATMSHQVSTDTQIYSLRVVVTDTILVDALSAIDVNGRGYRALRTIGNNTIGGATGYAGGSYGGRGGAANGTPNEPYGDRLNPDYPGAGGANAPGGGLVRLFADTIIIQGNIKANGTDHYYGSGSGGGILLNSRNLNVNGSISANGGSSGNGYGSGGGGRIAIYAWGNMFFPSDRITVAGGAGGTAGEAGTFVFPGSADLPTLPIFFWLSPTNELLHGDQRIGWTVLGSNPNQAIADVVAIGATTQYTIAEQILAGEFYHWDTTTIPDGRYQLHTTFYDKDSQNPISELTRPILVRNEGVAWHSGLLETDAVWNPDVVHIVQGEFTISQTLQIQPGTVVKFLHNSSMRLRENSILQAAGTIELPIVMTSIRDDTAGGDTNMDGPQTQPRPGDWGGFISEVGSTLALNDFVELRYMRTSQGGTLTENQIWLNRTLHEVGETVIVPNGVTLTIAPGAIVKFGPKVGIEVQSGGTLITNGTLAQPVFFTSDKDDAVGGDTNNDGNKTWPAIGDWNTIHVNGGTATFNYTNFLYGGGTDNKTWSTKAAPISSANNGQVSITNSTIHNSLFEGVIAWGSGNATIINSIIANCDRGVNADGSTLVRIVNSTIDSNRIGIWGHAGRLEILNTIISNSYEAGIHNILNSPLTLQYSNVWSSVGTNYVSMADQTGTNGNISADPRYKDGERGDYRLNFGSPAIDAADGSVAPERDMLGVPRYDDPRTGNTGTPMPNGAYPDMGAFEFVENANLVSTIDLVVTDVKGPANIVAGQPAKVEWVVTNQGSEAVVGPWHDRLSLTTDPEATSEILAGDVLVGNGLILGPGDFAEVAVMVDVPGAMEGDYYWNVFVNAREDVFEGKNRQNNNTTSKAPSELVVPELVIDGSALSGQFAHPGQSQWYKLTPDADMQEVLVDLDMFGDGVSELYVGKGYMPTRQQFDARHNKVNASDVQAVLPDISDDTYYVLAYGRTLPAAPTPFNIWATSRKGFGLKSVFPTTVINNTSVTYRVEGWGLNDTMSYELVSPANTSHFASTVNVVNSALAYPTFDMNGLETGSYDLVVSEGGERAELPGAIGVQDEPFCSIDIKVIPPGFIRPNSAGSFHVQYKNNGNVPIPSSPKWKIYGSHALVNGKDTYEFSAGNQGQVPGFIMPGESGVIELNYESTNRYSIFYNLEANVCGDTQYAHATTQVIWSWDPNDITGPAGAGDENWMVPGEMMPYLIRFENDAEEAQVPAQVVTVTQQLDPNLNLDTFRLLGYGFGDKEIDVSDTLDPFSYEHQIPISDTLTVGVSMDVISQTREVRWVFTSLDPQTMQLTQDPFEGFLRPNNEQWCGTNDPHCGEGFISYTIDQKPQLANGATISGQARIVFDTNEHIDTNTYINRIDTNAPSSRVSALPEITRSTDVPLVWGGSDTDGSGIAFYEIYVAKDGGPFTFWISSTNTLSATYQGEFEHTYGFYSVATDMVGHREGTPTAAQATTQLVKPDEPEPVPASITMQSQYRNIAAGGDTTVITATVKAENGDPIVGATVIFSTTLGGIIPVQATTNASGMVTTMLTSGDATGTATIVARTGEISQSIQVGIFHQVRVDAQQGATLSVTDDGLLTRLVIPDGAVEESITIRYREVDAVPTTVPGPTFGSVGRFFILEAFRGEQQIPLTFVTGKSATLTVGYDDTKIAANDEAGIRIFSMNGGNWSDEGIMVTEVDTTNNQVTATISHLTTFGLFYEPAEAPGKKMLYLPVIQR